MIELRPAIPHQLATAGRASGSVIAALRYLGKDHATPERIARLREMLSKQDRKSLAGDLAHAPIWMHSFLRAIATE